MMIIIMAINIAVTETTQYQSYLCLVSCITYATQTWWTFHSVSVPVQSAVRPCHLVATHCPNPAATIFWAVNRLVIDPHRPGFDSLHPHVRCRWKSSHSVTSSVVFSPFGLQWSRPQHARYVTHNWLTWRLSFPWLWLSRWLAIRPVCSLSLVWSD